MTAILLAYYVADAVHRYREYLRLKTTVIEFNDWSWGVPSLFDAKLGFRYMPDTTWEMPPYPPIHVNNSGHISTRDDQIEKPAGEYRIGVLGDSFATCFLLRCPWPDLLEDILNKDTELKQALGVASFKVVNAAMAGTGIVQWPAVYEYDLKLYQPDMVVACFINDDIARAFIWQKLVPLSVDEERYDILLTSSSLPVALSNPDSEVSLVVIDTAAPNPRQRGERAVADLRRRRIARVKWFSPRPELLIAGVGHWFGWTPRLSSPSAYGVFRVRDLAAAADASIEALQNLAQRHPNVLMVHNVSGYELFSANPNTDKLLDQLPIFVTQRKVFEARMASKGRPLPIVYSADYLPADLTRSEVASWFQGREMTGHFSDRGAFVYASTVAQIIRKRCLKALPADH